MGENTTIPLLHICRLKQSGVCHATAETCSHAVKHKRFHQPVCTKFGDCPELKQRVKCVVAQ